MRLTKRDRGGNAVMDCHNCEIKYRENCCSVYLCRNALIEKLAAYEDMGLSPEEIKLNMDGLDEYHKAEAEGRMVILPCKVGDTVWFYLYENRGGIRKGIYKGIITDLETVHQLNRDAPFFLAFVRFEYHDPRCLSQELSTSEMHCSFGEYGSWVQFYLTRAEAEAALKGDTEQDDCSRI